jgi:ribose transport system substrate-binding protein
MKTQIHRRGAAAPTARRRGSAVVAIIVAAACLATACSRADDGSTHGSTGTGSSDGSVLVVDAKALIAKYSVQPKFEQPGPSLDARKLAGKTIAVVAIDMRVPAIAEVSKWIQQVAAQAGLKTTTFDGQASPSLVHQGLTQAINAQAGAIVSAGLPIQLIGNDIKAAKDKGIPTIDVINTPPKVGTPGQGSDPNVFGNVAPDASVVGQLLAATAIANSDGKAHVSIMNTSELTVAATTVKGIKDELAKCSGCSVSTTDTALADWSTQLTGKAATTIRANPKINFLLPIFDAMGIFATAGVKQAGATGKVKIASFNGTAAALDLVKQGDVFVADPAQSNRWAAWAAVDQAMRGMLQMEPANPVLPIRYVNTADLKNVDVSSSNKISDALFGTEYQSAYRTLWGLS